MDDRRFDAFSRSLATGLSRRKALKLLFGGAVVGGAAATGLDQVAAQCPEGQFFCNDSCCPNANNCCGGETCCPPGQCNQAAGICCQSFEFACGTGDCCNTAEEKCCDGVCISRNLCCPSLPDCGACEECVQGACQPIQCDDCDLCIDGTCQSTCAAGEFCCLGGAAPAPYCASCCNGEQCPSCWDCVDGTCVQDGFLCGSVCCPLENNCCGGTTCCPPSQCNQTAGTCCLESEFACGTGDNACCDIQTEKCCDGVCIPAGLCCPSLPDCPEGLTCCDGECVDLQEDPTNCGACAADCSASLLCCAGECKECCGDDNCDSCTRCSTTGTCEPLLCDDPCEFCDMGVDACVAVCPENQFCCVFGPPNDTTIECVAGNECCEDVDCGDCGTCADGFCGQIIAICSEGLVPCCVDNQPVCLECCDDSDCADCTHCVEGACEPDTVLCTDGVACCVGGELICTECCLDSDCESCETCEDGVCVPLALPCPLGQVNCCVNDELICTECCDDSDCGVCELCHEGNCGPCETGGLECCNDVCVPEDECCVDFGDECGLQVSAAGGDWPAQLDCCDGLVCCETHHGSVCAECCSDHECPKGWICCLGQCRELECCIDDILVGLDPNRRCPEGCSCFEGICECHCQSNKDCAYGACCCKDGTCSEHCCDRGCDHDKDCGYGACCCHDGSCSAKCCKTYTPPVYTLPDTGSGSAKDGNGFALAGAAALAAYIAARKLRQQQPSEGEGAAEE